MMPANRLEVGMLIKTNYSGPYRIENIKRGCTCPLYIDEISMDSPPDQPPHIHLTVTKPGNKGKYWLNHFIEDTLMSIPKTYCGFKKELDHDVIIVLGQDKPIQMTLFD